MSNKNESATIAKKKLKFLRTKQGLNRVPNNLRPREWYYRKSSTLAGIASKVTVSCNRKMSFEPQVLFDQKNEHVTKSCVGPIDLCGSYLRNLLFIWFSLIYIVYSNLKRHAPTPYFVSRVLDNNFIVHGSEKLMLLHYRWIYQNCLKIDI